jgi:GNAT superfamily N-acetyltransferase
MYSKILIVFDVGQKASIDSKYHLACFLCIGRGMKVTTTILMLGIVAAEPKIVTSHRVLPTGEMLVFRPLRTEDERGLVDFLHSLSPQTRRFSSFTGDGRTAAREMCEAINRYDKLRMVAEVGPGLVALFELSFGLVAADKERYLGYGIELEESFDCRFGLCITDTYQNRGVGSTLLPFMLDIARRFGKRRILLWGGVLADNQRAIRYYKKNGFQMLGRFRDDQGTECYDGMLTLPETEADFKVDARTAADTDCETARG